jgi:hypothetical protein
LILVFTLVGSVSAEQASNPDPADSGIDVSVTAVLSWTAGSGAASHDVYFGTNFDNVNTDIRPGGDADGNGQVDWADVWVLAEQWLLDPTGLYPCPDLDGDNNVNGFDFAIIADSWNEQAGASFKGNQVGTTFDPGTLDNDTTYYWRIDEVYDSCPVVVWYGDVWSFTTIAGTGDEPVGWWELDESSDTTAADSSGNGNDGTLVGASWAPSSGKFGGAVSFNNVDLTNRVEVPTTGMTSSSGTVSVWGNVPGTRSGIRYFFGHTSSPTGYSDRIQLFMDGGNTQLDLGLGNSHFKHTNIMVLSTDTWYHIALTWDAGNYAVYVNAEEKATGTYSGLDSLKSVAHIGNDGVDSPDNGAFYGLLDDVRVYNYALGLNEINDIYAAGVTPPGQASNPSPSDISTDVSIDADLSWTAGSGSTSSDVYFGTTSPGTFRGNQTETTFEPGTLTKDTTYYWRIDGVNVAGTTTGVVWSFTTEAIPQPPGQASNPSPADSAIDVSIYTDLSWTAGVGAISHDIYFGTDPTPDSGEFQGNQATTTFDPDTLLYDTTYYWRIDELNSQGTTTGNVWSFTTEEQTQPPEDECDNWQSLHPEWIFCDDFEDDTAMVRDGRYFEYSNNGGDFVPLAGIGLDFSKGMRVIFQSGEVSAGGFKLGFGRNPNAYMNRDIRETEDFRDIYYRMYLKMQDGWVGSPGKLSRATSFSSSTDWSQAMIAHLWSGGYALRVDPVRCVDLETSLVKCIGYNDFAHMDWIGAVNGITHIFDSLHDDIWFCVEAHVRLNDPGTSNGVQEFWIDGQLEAVSNNLNFVASYTDYAINAIFFENYWNSGSPQLQERYFDNIVVSTQPIGCLD